MSVVGLLLTATVAATPVVERIQAAFEEVNTASTVARIEELTRPLIGKPYQLSPLGEGEGVDADPRLRWDAFDCLTFIETAMALVAAPSFDAVERVLDDVRYADAPSFINRNHFVEAQWLPSNVRKGYVRDISAEVAGEAVTPATKSFGPERWKARKKLASMSLKDDEIPVGTFEVPMVPLDVARARMSQIPAGTLLFVVREDYYTQPTRITHVGIVLGEGRRKVLRHAAGKPYQRVVDEPLENFLLRNARYTKWPVKGVALYRIEIPEARP